LDKKYDCTKYSRIADVTFGTLAVTAKLVRSSLDGL
jgi:hypothetical protein